MIEGQAQAPGSSSTFKEWAEKREPAQTERPGGWKRTYSAPGAKPGRKGPLRDCGWVSHDLDRLQGEECHLRTDDGGAWTRQRWRWGMRTGVSIASEAGGQ